LLQRFELAVANDQGVLPPQLNAKFAQGSEQLTRKRDNMLRDAALAATEER
jgi:hypothetical protein